jgi:hypothetical protein
VQSGRDIGARLRQGRGVIGGERCEGDVHGGAVGGEVREAQ